MSNIVIPCSAPTQCGNTLTEPEQFDGRGHSVNVQPYICPGCYRNGWRAEGLRIHPKELKVYRLPADQIPRDPRETNGRRE